MAAWTPAASDVDELGSEAESPLKRASSSSHQSPRNPAKRGRGSWASRGRSRGADRGRKCAPVGPRFHELLSNSLAADADWAEEVRVESEREQADDVWKQELSRFRFTPGKPARLNSVNAAPISDPAVAANDDDDCAVAEDQRALTPPPAQQEPSPTERHLPAPTDTQLVREGEFVIIEWNEDGEPIVRRAGDLPTSRETPYLLRFSATMPGGVDPASDGEQARDKQLFVSPSAVATTASKIDQIEVGDDGLTDLVLMELLPSTPLATSARQTAQPSSSTTPAQEENNSIWSDEHNPLKGRKSSNAKEKEPPAPARRELVGRLTNEGLLAGLDEAFEDDDDKHPTNPKPRPAQPGTGCTPGGAMPNALNSKGFTQPSFVACSTRTYLETAFAHNREPARDARQASSSLHLPTRSTGGPSIINWKENIQPPPPPLPPPAPYGGRPLEQLSEKARAMLEKPESTQPTPHTPLRAPLKPPNLTSCARRLPSPPRDLPFTLMQRTPQAAKDLFDWLLLDAHAKAEHRTTRCAQLEAQLGELEHELDRTRLAREDETRKLRGRVKWLEDDRHAIERQLEQAREENDNHEQNMDWLIEIRRGLRADISELTQEVDGLRGKLSQAEHSEQQWRYWSEVWESRARQNGYDDSVVDEKEHEDEDEEDELASSAAQAASTQAGHGSATRI